MRKLIMKQTSYLVLLLFVLQLFFPLVSALAANGNSILPPSNLTAQKVTPDDVKLTWSSVYGATGYNVYEIKEGQLILLGGTTTTSYNLNNLEEGSYSYIVSTLSAEGESGPSAPVTVDIVYPDMVAPATLTYTIQNGNDIVLNWGASQYAESYNLYEISADGQKTLLKTLTSRTYTISNAAAGNYTYSVSAVNSLYGESPLSTPAEVEVVYPTMKAPANFTYTVTNGNDVTLKWDAVPYTTNYKLYQIIDGQKVLKSTVTGTSVSYTKVPAGEYIYEVHSYSDRFGESAEGSLLTVTVGAVTMTAPSNFTYKIQNTNDIVLNWSSVPYATGYKVYQIIDGQKVLKSTVTGTSVSYTKVPAGEYIYEVHSYSDRFGESAEGSQVSLTIEAVTMAAPSNFTYKIQNGNDIVLSWDSVSNATSYKVYQIIDGQKVLKSTIAGTTVTYTNMKAGDYVYEVYSYSDRFGESQDGSRVAFSLVYPTMEPPANLVQTIKNATDFTLSWDASAYATSYKVYQVVNGQKTLRSTVTGTSVTYTNMAPGEYTYIVHSYSTRFGESAEGSQLTVTLNGQSMEAPTNLTYSIANGNDIILKWSPVQYATSYRIYQIVDGQKILKSTVTGTSVTYTNLPSGNYNYVVHSFSSLLGESPNGAELTISLVHPTMQAPGNLTYKIQNGNDVVLTWEAVQYATSYKVYELVDGQEVLKSTVSSLTATIAKVPAGEHTYIVRSVSTRFGESPEGSKVSLNLSEHMMQAPGNLTYSITNGNDITLKWDSVSYATAYKVYQIIDGKPILQKTVTGTSAAFINMPEGDYKYEVHSYSDRFGESLEGSEVSFNVVFPTMQAPSNLTYSITNGNDITLKWNAVTYATSYKIYQIIDGKRVLKNTVSGTSVTFTNMPEGDYKYEVHSYSTRFGESPEGSEISFTLVFPVMQAPANPTYSITNGNDITLRWNVSSYATAYKVYQIIGGERVLKNTVSGTSVTFTNMPEGDYTYEIHSYSNRFGESPEGSTLTFKLTWPVVQPPELTGTIFNVNNITLSWKSVPWANEYRVYQITGDSRKLIYKGTALSYKVYNLTEDTHSFEVTAYSTRFGESEPSNRITEKIVYPVMQPPVASLKLLSDTSVLITWNFVTYANGYNIYEVIDGKPILLAEKVNNLSYTISNLSYANHVYYVTSYSNSFGESEPSNQVLAKLIVDTEAPVTTTNVSTDWTNQNPVVTLTATDNETGVANTYYSLNDSDFVAGTSFTVEGEGVHKVSFYSIDKAGNKESIKTIYIKIDQSAPVTKVNEIPSWTNQPVMLKLTATDNGSGVAKTFYSINGSEFVEGTSFTVDKEGINKVSFYSVDKAGNVEKPQTIEVKIDKQAPVTVSDVNEIWSKENVTVNLTATDTQSGVAKTFYSINGSEYKEGTSFIVDNEGVNQVSFYSVDQAGNIEKPQTIEVKIDKTAPVTVSDANETWSKENVTVNLTATDSGSGVAKTFYSINGSEYVEGTSFTVDKEGINQVSFYSIDRVGNIEKPQTIEVKIDKTAPIINMEVNGEYKLGSDIQLLYSAFDDLSGVVSEQMIVYGPNETTGKVIANGTSLTLDKPGVYKVTIIATNGAGLTTTIEKQLVVYIPGTIEVTPHVIKGNKGIFTVRVELPEGYDSQGFDLNTAKLNGVNALTSNKGYYNQAKNGQFKFERSDFNWTSSEVTVEFRCYLDGYLVVGQTNVKVQN
jgi:fibronectin type 3 domain-containing protein